jgi:hypothetical protein
MTIITTVTTHYFPGKLADAGPQASFLGPGGAAATGNSPAISLKLKLIQVKLGFGFCRRIGPRTVHWTPPSTNWGVHMWGFVCTICPIMIGSATYGNCTFTYR